MAITRGQIKKQLQPGLGRGWGRAEKSKFRKVAISESLWPKPGGVIKAINGVEEVKKMPGFENIFFRYGVGDYINDYIDCTKRVCFIICSGLTLAETRENMLKIKEKVNFSIEK